MQRWLKRITPDRTTLEKHWVLKPFAAIVAHSGCWAFHRASVTRAFAVGLFIAFVPPTPFPLHMILCAVLGIGFRLNLPVLFMTVFVSNPFTWLPQVVGSIWVGALLMGRDLMPVVAGLNLHSLWHTVGWHTVGMVLAPLLLGALFLGAAAAAVGYVLAQCLWRARVVYLLRRRRARCLARRRPLDQDSVH